MTTLVVFAALAILVSFLCSVAEAVLLSVTPTYIGMLEIKSPKLGSRLLHLKTDVDRPLAAILTLNTIAHTVGATGVGAEAVRLWGSGVVGITSAVMTLLILFASEIVPKTLGAIYWRGLVPVVVRFLLVLVWVLGPIVWVSERLTRILGKGEKHSVTRQEVQAVADLGVKSGELAPDEARILRNLLKFPSMTVEDIMTPRTVVVAVSDGATADEAVDQIRASPASRIPVFASSIDDVRGFVLRADLLAAKADGNGDTLVSALLRDIIAVPTSFRLFRLFDVFIRERQQLALVVDEYGGTRGVVSMEDLFEALLGTDIVDEDDRHVNMRTLAREIATRQSR